MKQGWIAAAAVLVVAALAAILSRSESPERRTPKPVENGVEPEPLAPERPPVTDERPGSLRVSVREPPEGRVPVAVVDAERIRLVKKVPINERVPLSGDVPEGQPFLLAAIDDLSRSPLLVELRSRYVWPAPVLVGRDEWPRDVEIRFREASSERRIVIAARTVAGRPVVGAVFNVSMTHAATVAPLPVAFPRSNKEGLAKSPRLPRGKFRVLLHEAPGVLRLTGETVAQVDLNQEGDAGVTFLFQEAGALTGVVRAQPNRKYPVDVLEKTGSATPFIRALHTDEDGRFALASLPPGDYVAVTWPRGYMETSAEFTVAPGQTTHLVLVPQRGGSIVIGRFLDQEGRPLALKGVNINTPLRPGMRPSGRPFGTDAEGRLRAEGIAPGEKLAILWDYGYLRRFSIGAGTEEHDLGTFRLPRLEGGVTVRGNASDDEGTALRSALVCLQPVGASETWARFATTDGGGDYRIDHVAQGRYLIWHEPLARTNFVARRRPDEIVVDAGEVRFDLRLPRP